MEEEKNSITITDIEKIESFEWESSTEEDYPLVNWYKKVRIKMISDLSDEDVIRFIRQKMYEKYMVTEAIKRL